MIHEHELTLGVSLNDRGFGYVVLQGPTRLVDWKVKRTPPPKIQKTIEGIGALIGLYRPSHLVFDAPDDGLARRALRTNLLLRAIGRCAADHGVIPVPVPLAAVTEAFAPMEASTRHDIAQLLTMQFPELSPYIPPRRRLWDSESRAMSVFNATALVMTFFERGAD